MTTLCCEVHKLIIHLVTAATTQPNVVRDDSTVTDTPITRENVESLPFLKSAKRGRPLEPCQDPFELTVPLDIPEDAPIDPVDDEVYPEMIRMKSFYMHEQEKVKAFLQNRIERIHQLSDKKIAKAWIKGICPKKQATFPYQNKQREKDIGQPPVVPEWWPPVETCPFTEPDHITRERKQGLLSTQATLHLLTLYSTQ